MLKAGLGLPSGQPAHCSVDIGPRPGRGWRHGCVAVDLIGRQMLVAEAEPDAKCRSASWSTFGDDCSPMQLDELLNEGQADTGPLETATASALDAMKAVEHARQLRLGDADAGVGNLKLDSAAPLLQADNDAALECELEGVRQEVEDDFFPEVAVNEDRI